MKHYFEIKLALIVLLFLTSCTEQSVSPNIDYQPELNVFALLILNNQQKIVRVERSYRVDEYLPEDTGISNAQISISSESQNVQFQSVGQGNYRDVDNALLLSPGVTYNLLVKVPDGRQVTGRCIMPGKPKIIIPESSQEVRAYQPLEIKWQAGNFAHRYICVLYDLEKDFTPQMIADSTAIKFYAFFFASPDVYTLKVMSTDRNYYDHIRTGDNTDDIVHLEGGLGVFGALAYDEVTFVAK